MRAVNLLPPEARGGRGRGPGGAGGRAAFTGIGPGWVVVGLLLVVVVLILLSTLAGNRVKDDQATLAALNTQIATEQTEASRLGVFTAFIGSVRAREASVYGIAVQRFPWKRTFLQLSSVMPATTSLTSLSATTAAASVLSTRGDTVSGPTFTLSGCADTPDQNGVATLLRRLGQITGVINVGFTASTRSASCGNQFSLALTFAPPAGSVTVAPATSAPATVTPAPVPTVTTATATVSSIPAVPATTSVVTTGAGTG